MEQVIQLDRAVAIGGERRSTRGIALVAVLALVIGGLVLARNATAPVSSDKIVNVDGASIEGVAGSLGKALGFGAAPAQINIGAIVCPILNALIAQIPFLGPILQPVRVLFGCVSA